MLYFMDDASFQVISYRVSKEIVEPARKGKKRNTGWITIIIVSAACLDPPWKCTSRWPICKEHPEALRVGCPLLSIPTTTPTDRDTLLTERSQLPWSLMSGLQMREIYVTSYLRRLTGAEKGDSISGQHK